MRLAFTAAAVLLLPACGNTMTPEEKAAADARAVAEVEANQEAPPEMVVPQPILLPDIEKNGLGGPGCAFVADGAGMGALVLTREDGAAIKRRDEVVRFAADKGSRKNPLGTFSKYDAKDVALEITIDADGGSDSGSQSARYPARVTLRDGGDRVVYEAEGLAQCMAG